MFVGQCCKAENVGWRVGSVYAVSSAVVSFWGEAHAAFDGGRREDEMSGDVMWGEEGKTVKETQVDCP